MSKITNEQVAQLAVIISHIEDVLYEDVALSDVIEELTKAADQQRQQEFLSAGDLDEANDIVKNAAMQIDSAKDELFAAIDRINSVIHSALVVEE